jgi:hypothetical protein
VCPNFSHIGVALLSANVRIIDRKDVVTDWRFVSRD